MSVASCLTPVDQVVLAIADNTDCSAAVAVNTADCAGGQTQGNEAAFGTEDLSAAACGSGHLAALAGFQLDVVDECSVRDVLHFHGVADLDVNCLTGDDGVTDLQSFRVNDVSLFTVGIVDQSDVGVAVRIVFDGSDLAPSCSAARADSFPASMS